MKKFALIIASAVAAVTLASCGSGQTNTAPMGFIEISDEALTYDLFVPDEWTPDLSTGVTAAYYNGRDPSNISMTAFELDRSITSLDDYWKLYEEDFVKHFPELEYIENGTDIKLDGSPAKQYIYTVNMGEDSYKLMQIVSIRNNQVYIFTYTALETAYDTHIEDVLAMLEYFCFK